MAAKKKSVAKSSKVNKKTLKKAAPQKVSQSPRRSKKTSNEAYLQIAGEHWPLEKDVLFRPDRLKYVRKLVKAEGCVFCHAAKSQPTFASLCVYQTQHSMIVINKFPYNSGHVLILPKRHCGDLLALSEAEFLDLNQTLRLAMQAVQDIYQPGGINLGLNHGAVAGAGIPEHLHYHLVPRWSGDYNFFPLIAETKVLVESLEQTFERLLSYFKKYE